MSLSLPKIEDIYNEVVEFIEEHIEPFDLWFGNIMYDPKTNNY